MEVLLKLYGISGEITVIKDDKNTYTTGVVDKSSDITFTGNDY